jgi:peptidoglycan/LPS O-acetylase OafA/YrhL
LTAQLDRRDRGLDILRALAVFMVMGHHMVLCPSQYPLPHAISVVWHRGGWTGVDLFFVLSGFLVSGLLFREHQKRGTISFRNFFLRRGLKIWPAFWIMIAATVAGIILGGDPINIKQLFAELLFVQNYVPGFCIHTWSLAVEEHFYLVLPVLLIVLTKCNKSNSPFAAIPLLTLFIAVACLTLRWLTSANLHNAYACLYQTHLRADSLFFGVFLSYLYHYFPDRLKIIQNKFNWLLGAVLFIPAFVFPLEETMVIGSVGLTLFYLGAGLLLLSILSVNLPENALVKCLGFLGSRSYSIYLWHVNVNGFIVYLEQQYGQLNWFVYAVLYLLGAVLVGVYMARLVEIPVLKLRDRLFPSRSI